jgi:hypothetical protein
MNATAIVHSSDLIALGISETAHLHGAQRLLRADETGPQGALGGALLRPIAAALAVAMAAAPAAPPTPAGAVAADRENAEHPLLQHLRNAAHPHFVEVTPSCPGADLHVCSHANASALVLSAPRGTLRLHGPWEAVERGPAGDDVLYVAVADGHRRLARIVGMHGHFVLVVDGGQAHWLEVDEALEGLADFALGPVHESAFGSQVHAPPLDQLVNPAYLDQTPGWLKDLFRDEAQSPSSLDRIAAPGHVARLWSPPKGTGAAFMAGLERGERDFPGERVRAWCKDNALHLQALEGDAMEEARQLEDTFRDVGQLLPVNDEERQAALVHLAHERDRLESIAWALHATRTDEGQASSDPSLPGESLRRALEIVDRAAAVQWSVLRTARLKEDPQCVAAGFANAEHWWGGLALQSLA